MPKKWYLKWWAILIYLLIAGGFVTAFFDKPKSYQNENKPVFEAVATSSNPTTSESNTNNLFKVIKVVDGDTIDVDIDGKVTRLRLIGMDTPEVVDPRKPVQCFGQEASNKAKELLVGQSVGLESDPSQDEIDKYGRTLRYVYLADGRSFNKLMIEEGYAYEYTYNIPYKYQAEYKQAQKTAEANKAGLWADDACKGIATPVITTTSSLTQPKDSSCTIKGNISSTGEKIYHLIGCGSYAKTQIDESQGEKWFCSENEAQTAGWRKAKNCP